MSTNPFAPVLRSLRKWLGLDATTTDGLLLERFVSSQDETAFAALVERNAGLVWGGCRRVTRDDHAAEDAVLATWIVLARKADSLRNGSSLPGWLHRVAFRLALSARTKRQDEPLPEVLGSKPEPVTQMALAKTCTLVDEEVERLPEKYRLPVLLCFFQGRSHAEAAAELGGPVGTVPGWLARAKDILHARLTRRGLDLPVFPLPVVAGAIPTVASGTAGGTAWRWRRLLSADGGSRYHTGERR